LPHKDKFEVNIMITVAGVRLRVVKDIEYAAVRHLDLKLGDRVIVETEHGMEEGMVCEREKEIENLKSPISKIIRKINEFDKRKLAENKDKSLMSRSVVLQFVAKCNLDMKLTCVQYTFDRSKLFIYYTSETRVDFRELVKDLGHALKTRIQMVQIGVRDEAKLVGGIGTCGQILCCRNFLKDFTTVTMDMAKDQDLSLNSAKLSGICGRLMCCISYENDVYAEIKKDMPEIGSDILTPDGKAKLAAVDCIKKKVTADFGDKNFKTFTIDEIKNKNQKDLK
jgi:cell fate regulator YaaT (PSP1 superfamily)